MCVQLTTKRKLTMDVVVGYKAFHVVEGKLVGIYYNLGGTDSSTNPVPYKQGVSYLSGEPGFQTFIRKEDALAWGRAHGNLKSTVVVPVQLRLVLGTGYASSLLYANLYGELDSCYIALEMTIPKNAERTKVVL